MSFWQKVKAWWDGLPQPVRTWLQGLEVFVWTGVIAAVFAYPMSDLSTTAGVEKFLGIAGAAALACVRLYLKQSPIQNVVKEVTETHAIETKDASVVSTVTEKTTGEPS